MKSFFTKILLLLGLVLTGYCSCNVPEQKPEPAGKVPVGTPVTVTTILTDTMAEYLDLNATSVFLQKSYVKANVNGYVQAVKTMPGQYVSAGSVLFTVKTKEAQSIDNSVTKLDPSFRFSGINNIKTSTGGYVTQLNHQVGDYVQDGEQLAVLSDQNSFAFILNLPYELKPYLANNKMVSLALPDGTKINGEITTSMPSVDAATQTLNVVIKIASPDNLPENLIAKVRIVKYQKSNANSLPKAALLTNDTQTEFWVMKLIDSVTAVKVTVKKGIETADRVEIIEPRFSIGDKILLTGNFGLPDTAKVRIEQ